MSIDGHLDAILTGFGSSPVQVNGWTGRGLFDINDTPEVAMVEQGVLVRESVLKLRRSDHVHPVTGAITIADGDTITIDGLDYVVAQIRRGGNGAIDGRELHVVVKRVAL